MGFAITKAVLMSIASVIALLSTLPIAIATLYKVGDSAGWSINNNVNYQQWAAEKTFKVGDIIRFQYNNDYHNVVRVTHLHYRSCNATAPIATFTSGNDTFRLHRPTHLFFICSVPGHCQAGQKVDVRVPSPSSLSTPTPKAPPAQLAAGVASPAPTPSDTAAPVGNSSPSLSLLRDPRVVFACALAWVGVFMWW